jgi:hypothetical protein
MDMRTIAPIFLQDVDGYWHAGDEAHRLVVRVPRVRIAVTKHATVRSDEKERAVQDHVLDRLHLRLVNCLASKWMLQKNAPTVSNAMFDSA